MNDPERIEIVRCPRCGGLPRPTLMGQTICDRCGGIEVHQSAPRTADTTNEGRDG